MKNRSTQPPFSAIRLDRLARQACLLAVILVLAWTPGSFGQDRKRRDFYFASLINDFTGMHAKDSLLAMQSIMQKIINPKYPEVRLHLDILSKDSGSADAISRKGYDVIATTGMDFLSLQRHIRLQPLAILSKTDHPTDTYLLITRKNKTLKTVGALPIRSLILEAGGGCDFAKCWLDGVLEDRGLPQHQKYFNIVRTAEKPSRTLLPVFFGQADACVVSESALSVMIELNPQLEDQLVVEERSAGYISIMISATERLEDCARDIVLEETEHMHSTPEGRQILTLMQMKRFFRFKPEYLDATERIYMEQQRIGGGG